MRMHFSLLAIVVVALTTLTASAKDERPNFRIRAKFRTPGDAPWGPDESVGNADFRVKSRFMQIYYGGVMRSDEFGVKVQFDFRDVSGFDTEFLTSPYNDDFDIYINNGFVGRMFMNTDVFGMGKLEYDSRNPNPPVLPLPVGFPDPVNVFDTVSVFGAASVLPDISNPLPSSIPLFMSELIEEYARGDANQDGKVDEDDFVFLAENYDPHHVLSPYVGPTAGDFTGDNRSDLEDYNLFVANWTEGSTVPDEPDAVIIPSSPGDINLDEFIDGTDLALFIQHFGSSNGGAFTTGDFNDDGKTDLADLLLLKQHFGQAGSSSDPGGTSAVPEPSSLILSFIGILGLTFVCRLAKKR